MYDSDDPEAFEMAPHKEAARAAKVLKEVRQAGRTAKTGRQSSE